MDAAPPSAELARGSVVPAQALSARLPLLYHNVLVSARAGGAERLAIQIHKHVVESRGARGELLVPLGGETHRLVAAEGLDFRTYRMDWVRSPGRVRQLAANFELAVKLSGLRRGVLHVHSPFVYGALRPFLRVTRLKTILHLHLEYTREQLEWALKAPPDLAIVCAGFMRESVADALRANHASDVRIVTAINAVDTKRFAPSDRARARREARVEPGRPVFLMAANLSPHKGQATAIRALALLVARGLRPQLWLVGEERDSAGTYTRTLRELVGQLGLGEAVQFLGFRSDVAKLLHAADCLLLPSTHEGLPLSILEAQASKVLVLAAPTAGIPEVIEHGRTGFLIAADDPGGYADTLAAVLDNPDLMNTVTEAAYRQVVASFALDRYCERVLAEYDELLGGN